MTTDKHNIGKSNEIYVFLVLALIGFVFKASPITSGTWRLPLLTPLSEILVGWQSHWPFGLNFLRYWTDASMQICAFRFSFFPLLYKSKSISNGNQGQQLQLLYFYHYKFRACVNGFWVADAVCFRHPFGTIQNSLEAHLTCFGCFYILIDLYGGRSCSVMNKRWST